jgi:hypothetical protein
MNDRDRTEPEATEDLEPTEQDAEAVTGGADFNFVRYMDKSTPVLGGTSAPPPPPPTK